MKAFTDIEQSKKLAEILPIESADMWFHPYPNDEYWYDIPNFGNADLKYNQLPCWSLAALIEQLPVIEECKPLISLAPNGECDMAYILALTVDVLYVHASNLLDACVEMTTKLHKQKLL